jgi:SAM-dependent methyltransferase
MIIRYQSVEDFVGWSNGPAFLRSLVEKYKWKDILEVGSGANPTLDPEYVHAHKLRYVTSDLSEEELEKADPEFERLVIDVSAEIDTALYGSYDCVFSRMVGEHIRDGAQYHKNIFKVLRPGGLAVHCMSCLGTLPFVMNRMLPDGLTDLLLRFFAPRPKEKHGKFKAYYSWASGPSKNMIERFKSVGFEIVEYIGCFGHLYYQNRAPLLHRLEKYKTMRLLQHPVPQLCSYATLILRKPQGVAAVL